jgi:hypothetical protein
VAAVLGGLALLVIVSLLSTTKESRAEARRKFARWNPLFIAVSCFNWHLFSGRETEAISSGLTESNADAPLAR